MHSQNSDMLNNVLKIFSERRITSNNFKDNASRTKNQAFFEIYYTFSNNFLKKRPSGRRAHPAQAPDRAIRLNKVLPGFAGKASFACQNFIPLLSLARLYVKACCICGFSVH
jgi:hypothetical protein